MSEEELMETLKAFEKDRVEQLKEPAKNLFYAIMKIADERDSLKEELKELNGIIEIGRKREYHSKFLKDFQKERGKNVFPDHDEIYKRYDDYKLRVEKADKEIERLHSIINEFMEELKWQRKVCLSLNEGFTISRIDTLINKLQELKGSDKE